MRSSRPAARRWSVIDAAEKSKKSKQIKKFQNCVQNVFERIPAEKAMKWIIGMELNQIVIFTGNLALLFPTLGVQNDSTIYIGQVCCQKLKFKNGKVWKYENRRNPRFSRENHSLLMRWKVSSFWGKYLMKTFWFNYILYFFHGLEF